MTPRVRETHPRIVHLLALEMLPSSTLFCNSPLYHQKIHGFAIFLNLHYFLQMWIMNVNFYRARNRPTAKNTA